MAYQKDDKNPLALGYVSQSLALRKYLMNRYLQGIEKIFSDRSAKDKERALLQEVQALGKRLEERAE